MRIVRHLVRVDSAGDVIKSVADANDLVFVDSAPPGISARRPTPRGELPHGHLGDIIWVGRRQGPGVRPDLLEAAKDVAALVDKYSQVDARWIADELARLELRGRMVGLIVRSIIVSPRSLAAALRLAQQLYDLKL